MKFTIIAGTHQRENEFSHSLADKLVGKLNLKKTNEFSDEYDTRKAEVYDSEKIAIAKIHPIRELPREYYETVDEPSLEEYVEKKLMNVLGKFTPAFNAERFQLKPEWTAVYEKVLQDTNPKFYIDLHSYHKQTEGVDGKTLQITVSSDDELRNHFENILYNVQTKENEKYNIKFRGNPKAHRKEHDPIGTLSCKTEKELEKILRPRIQRELKNLGKNALIEFLSEDKVEKMALPRYAKEDIRCLELVNEELNRKWNYNEKLFSQKYPQGWFFNFERKTDSYNKVHFEAVHWGEKNQQLIADFITDYLM